VSPEIVDRMNELLECERAGVEAALGLGASGAPGFTHGELQKFAEDEGWACGGLRRAILRVGGTPSERTGGFAEKVIALASEGERVSLLARGQVWVVKRVEALLAKDLDPQTRAFLVEMREQHLENIARASSPVAPLRDASAAAEDPVTPRLRARAVRGPRARASSRTHQDQTHA